MPLSNQLPFDFILYNEFTFENFIVAEKNKELLTVLQTVNLAESFYFIWGAKGSGKSHVLQASCAQHANSAYLPLNVFLDEGESVLEGLDQLDWLCIDDVHLVLGKSNWEEKLFTLFNACQISSTCLIVSSLLAPLELKYVLPDLQSRFSSGVTYQLHELNEPEKLLALKKRAELAGIPLKDEVLNYIYLRSERSMSVLFSVLEQLDKLSLAEKRKITIPFVKAIMQW
ncbi:MAG: DnaA regulatory inactivator Hda [SAR86 cluster bacterium]|uniref:DnaA regulatory inactivator Hda n=1 Tax=SAR86 cluster bacterium TaxID=2030880 RepID=A0A2A5CFJ2_9GAMM|nr:MAG: DnaA regulatory inactivator Hda [SAR86 cluster bacterium]